MDPKTNKYKFQQLATSRDKIFKKLSKLYTRQDNIHEGIDNCVKELNDIQFKIAELYPIPGTREVHNPKNVHDGQLYKGCRFLQVSELGRRTEDEEEEYKFYVWATGAGTKGTDGWLLSWASDCCNPDDTYMTDAPLLN